MSLCVNVIARWYPPVGSKSWMTGTPVVNESRGVKHSEKTSKLKGSRKRLPSVFASHTVPFALTQTNYTFCNLLGCTEPSHARPGRTLPTPCHLSSCGLGESLAGKTSTRKAFSATGCPRTPPGRSDTLREHSHAARVDREKVEHAMSGPPSSGILKRARSELHSIHFPHGTEDHGVVLMCGSSFVRCSGSGSSSNSKTGL